MGRMQSRTYAAARQEHQGGKGQVHRHSTANHREGRARLQDIDIYIPCDSLSDRKDLLLAHSDVIIALPGGIGTLDEIFTVAAAHTIGYHNKKIILLNAKGFWDSLIAMLDDLQSKGVIRGLWRDYILVANSVDEAVSAYLSTDMWEN